MLQASTSLWLLVIPEFWHGMHEVARSQPIDDDDQGRTRILAKVATVEIFSSNPEKGHMSPCIHFDPARLTGILREHHLPVLVAKRESR
jgi:hypothetical protein